MSDFVQEATNNVGESFANLLTTQTEHPWVIAGVGALALGSAAAIYVRERRAQPAYAIESPNSVALERALQDTKTGERSEAVTKAAFRREFWPKAAALTGAGLIVANALGGITFETTEPHEDANTIVVLDTNYAMGAEDLGQSGVSRHDAVLGGLEDAADTTAGNVGVLETAANAEVRIPLSSNWANQVPLLAEPVVNQNGTELNIDTALSLLPQTEELVDEVPQRDGSMVIITSGIATNVEALTASAEKLAAEGVDVSVVITGTTSENAVYRVAGGAPVAAPANAAPFIEAFGSDAVREATTVDEVDAAVAAALEDGSSIKTRHPSTAVGVLGAGLLAGSMGWFITRGSTIRAKFKQKKS